MQAAWCPAPTSNSGGSRSSHASIRIGQRGANGQPGGRAAGAGGWPSIGTSARRPPASTRGTEPSNPTVYGMRVR